MAIAYRSSATASGNFGTTSLSPSKPSGTVDGDLLVAALSYDGGNTIATITPPAGWTSLTGRQDNGNTTGLWVWYKIASGEGASWTWSFSSTRAGIGVTCWSGVDTTTPIDVAAGYSIQTGNAGSATLNSVTTQTANAVLLAIVNSDTNNGGGDITAPTGFTERYEHANQNCSQNDMVQAVAGASGGFTAALAATRNYVAVLTALRPAGAGGGAQTIEPSHLTSTATLHSPAVTVGAVTVAPSHLSSTAAIHSPAVSVGAVSLSPDHLAASTTVHSPAVVPGAVTVVPDHLAASTVLHNPAVSTGGAPSQDITPAHLAATSTVHEPAVTVGSVTVSPAHLASGATVHEPAVHPGAVTVEPDPISSGATVHSPSVSSVVTVQPDVLSSGAALFSPAVSVGAVTISPDHLASTTTLFSPTVSGGEMVDTPASRTVTASAAPRTVTASATARTITTVATPRRIGA